MVKLKWKEIGQEDYTTQKGDRVFRLKKDYYGVMGIGKAYYLTTKLISESEFKPVASICVSGDNHGKEPDVRLVNLALKSGVCKEARNFIFRRDMQLNDLYNIAEKDYIDTLF